MIVNATHNKAEWEDVQRKWREYYTSDLETAQVNGMIYLLTLEEMIDDVDHALAIERKKLLEELTDETYSQIQEDLGYEDYHIATYPTHKLWPWLEWLRVKLSEESNNA